MAHFLFASLPVPGHVAPIAPVARTLIDRGHQVTWYGSRHFADEIEATGARFVPITSTLDYGDSDYDRHFPERVRLNGLRQVIFDFEHLFVGAIEGYVTDLRAIAAEQRPDVLVIDPLVVGGVVISDADGLPTAIVNITVLSLESVDTAPFGLGLAPGSGRISRLRNRALYGLVDQVVFRRVNRAYRDLARLHGWPVYPFRPMATKWLYLQPSVPALEYPRSDLPPQVHYVGPLLPEPDRDFQPPDWWPDLLAARAAGTKVVLVTQGMLPTDSSELIEPTLAALADREVFVVAAGADPARLPAVPPNARAAAFVPFVELMPLVDAYLTNGGFGGVTIALANGVPVVIAGRTEDKAEVGGRVAHAGAGINLRTNRPSRRRISEAVATVLADPRYRDRARAVAEDFAGHNGPVEAAVLLERLAATGAPVLHD